MTTCMVCQTDIEQQTAFPETGYGSEYYPPAQAEYQGAVYHFCSTDHKETFQANPNRFVTPE